MNKHSDEQTAEEETTVTPTDIETEQADETATEDSPWYVCQPTTSGSRALASPYRESGRCHLGRRS